MPCKRLLIPLAESAAPEDRRSPKESTCRAKRLLERETLTAFADFCREAGEQEPTVALAWILAQPATTAVIIGPRTLDQLNASLRAIELKLDNAFLSQLDAISSGPGTAAPEAYAW